ncbi:diaminopimelate decarboxylase [Vibrio variabilis]|uniref:Diaminopimelate decarboxylase n=1 Tax=Vibrio variabilis TaxID=990271 RepID=A0ABQ0JJQ0_9VIBR|nr:diaminopimelate decarboxylase [Vibrio variabilis]
MKYQARLEDSVKQLSSVLEEQKQLLAEHKANQNYAERLQNILTPTDELTTKGDDFISAAAKLLT